MLEIFQGNVSAGGEYPYHDDKFLGEVASANLIDGPLLAMLTGYTAGIAVNDAGGWLKYKLVDGPEILVAKLPIRYRVSWDSLNAAGVVFGSKTVPAGGKRYKVRLMKGAEKDPTDWLPTMGTENPAILIPSEWSRLIYRSSSSNVGKATTFPGTNFADAAIGVGSTRAGRSTITQETLAGVPTGANAGRGAVIGRGNAGAGTVGYHYKDDGTASAFGHYGWRPVLEYVEDLPVYPDSGPGVKTLQFGNDDLGYFGEVSGAELFTAREFYNKTQTYFGTFETAAEAQVNMWLKFFHKKKVIYIAKYPILSGVSWDEIYGAGLIFGTQDNGKFPAAEPVWQFNPLSKADGAKEWSLVPRVIRGLNVDSYTAFTESLYVGSEWTDLLGRVANVTNTPVAEKWANFSPTQLGLGALSMGMETNSGSPNLHVYLGTGSAAGYSARTNATKNVSNLPYRPVLELLDPNTMLIPAVDITIESSGIAQLEMVEGKVAEANILYPVSSLETTDYASKLVRATYSIDSSTAQPISTFTANDDTSTWGSFTISGSYTA